MASKVLTTENFDRIVSRPGLVLVDFWAGWCGPCRTFAPIFERVSDKHPEIVFGKVDTEAEQALARRFGISSIPTLMVIRDGMVLYTRPGALPEAAVEQLIDRVRAVDMAAVQGKPATAPRRG